MVNKTKTILTAMVTLACLPFMSTTHADHDTQHYWVDEDVEYKCLNNINKIPKTNNVSPCSDFSIATNYWDNVSNSTWDLDPYPHGSRVNVTGASLHDDDWAAVAGTTRNGDNTIEYGYVQFNTTFAHTFGDVTAGDNNAIDFEYVAVHEIGHLLRLTHSNVNGSIMEPAVGTGDDFLGLHAHDIAEIQGKYST